MKKLIFTLTTVFALSSFAKDSCPEGSLDCADTNGSGAGVIAAGISCVGCAAQEKAEDAKLRGSTQTIFRSGGSTQSKPTQGTGTGTN
ncbi:MAG: hypothetical protein H7328_09435 [Bdellovibrio sp.]|nr:hypothetical protein [Bdellovibrio sp.]